MRNRIAGLCLFLAAAAATTFAGPSPAMADSTQPEEVTFYNNGWYYAYADIWGYDKDYKEVYHDWTGTGGHGYHKTLTVPANVAHVHWMIRYDPTGETIHEQWLDWWDFNDNCRTQGKHATMYTGGTWHSADSYDMHCSNWD